MVSYFDITLSSPPISPTYYSVYGSISYPMVGSSVVLSADLSTSYIGGTISGELLLMKMAVSTGTF
jgi:hypothetical protein